MQALDPQLAEALQAQHTQERLNAAFYTALQQTFTAQGLEGFARWADGQASEEVAHARLFADYLTDKRGVIAATEALEPVNVLAPAPLDAFLLCADLEARNTAAIWALYAQAQTAGDWDVMEFLQYFLREQRHSEAAFKNWIAQLGLITGDGCGLLAFDERLKP